MAKRYIKLEKPIKEYSGEELRARLGVMKNSELLRTIILNEKEFLNINYTRSLRSFWYSTVKPTLEKLGLLTEKDQTEEGLTKWDNELSRYTGELVKLGVLTYKDLKIIDQSRKRENPEERYNIVNIETYGYMTNIAPYSNIIISTEKDTVYNIILDIARLFGCSCISGKGQNSLGAMEDLLRGMNETEKDIYILTMTDYDPSGYYIAETFKNQVEGLKYSLELKGNVSIERIGIFPKQLTAEEVESNKYTPKQANRDKWFKQTGGINGEPKGLELDAFSPERIREIFVTSLKKYIDEEKYKNFIKQAYIKSIVLDSLQGKIEDISREAINKEKGNIQLKDFNIFSLGIDGYNAIPVQSLCSENRDSNIQELAISYFK